MMTEMIHGENDKRPIHRALCAGNNLSCQLTQDAEL